MAINYSELLNKTRAAKKQAILRREVDFDNSRNDLIDDYLMDNIEFSDVFSPGRLNITSTEELYKLIKAPKFRSLNRVPFSNGRYIYVNIKRVLKDYFDLIDNQCMDELMDIISDTNKYNDVSAIEFRHILISKYRKKILNDTRFSPEVHLYFEVIV